MPIRWLAPAAHLHRALRLRARFGVERGAVRCGGRSRAKNPKQIPLGPTP